MKGSVWLRDWLKHNRVTRRALAQMIGVDPGQVYAWLADKAPSLTSAVSIERVTGIPVETWVSVDELAQEASWGRDSTNRSGQSYTRSAQDSPSGVASSPGDVSPKVECDQECLPEDTNDAQVGSYPSAGRSS